MPQVHEIPARAGRAVKVGRGQALRIINTFGHQVVDFWAFHTENPAIYLSMEHSRVAAGRLNPRAGDKLVDNQRAPIVMFESDQSPGIHDGLLPACDRYRYQLLGCKGYHDSCADNLQRALAALDMSSAVCPASLNLWMNIPIDSVGALQYLPPVSKPGDALVLRALVDCVMVMSACPQDLLPVNAGKPVAAHYELLAD